MKTLLLLTAAAIGLEMLSGCTTHETTTAATTTANPARQTYSSSQLRQTGQPNTAGAIEAVDSSAQVR